MEKKFRYLKIIVIICIVILIVQYIYIISLPKTKYIYFDGINSVINIKNGYVAVGCNNNNENYYEKAKITKYNSKKEKVFEKIYNKGYNGVFFDVVEDKENNLIAVGSFEPDVLAHDDKHRVAIIVIYDKDGNLLYENTFKILDNSKFTSVEILDDGYVVTGQSVYDDLDVGLSENGGAFVIKYNKKLKMEWKSNFGDSKSASYNDIVAYGGFLYAVGVVDNNIGVISKYDMQGNLIKSNYYKYTDNLGFTGIVRFENSLFIVSAKKEESDKTDALIIKSNLELDFEVENVYQGDYFERFNQAIIDSHGDIVVVGTSAKVEKVDLNDNVNVFLHDGLIGKYDNNLSKVSVVNYGDDRDDYFTDIILSDGGYLVSGYSSYEDGSYLSKFIKYSDALKALEVS